MAHYLWISLDIIEESHIIYILNQFSSCVLGQASIHLRTRILRSIRGTLITQVASILNQVIEMSETPQAHPKHHNI